MSKKNCHSLFTSLQNLPPTTTSLYSVMLKNSASFKILCMSHKFGLFFSSLNKNFGQNTRRTEKLLISDDQLHPITTAAHQILLCEVVNCTHLAHARIHSIARVRLRPKAVEKRAVHEVGGAAALEVDVVIVAHTHTLTCHQTWAVHSDRVSRLESVT